MMTACYGTKTKRVLAMSAAAERLDFSVIPIEVYQLSLDQVYM